MNIVGLSRNNSPTFELFAKKDSNANLTKLMDRHRHVKVKQKRRQKLLWSFHSG